MATITKTTIENVSYVKVSDVIKRLENMQKKERKNGDAGSSSRISRIQSLIDDIVK